MIVVCGRGWSLMVSSYKDRSSSTTKLSAEESLRFRRAVYRFWNIQDAIGPQLNVRAHYGDDPEPWSPDQMLVQELNKFSDSSLSEMDNVMLFLCDVQIWARSRFPRQCERTYRRVCIWQLTHVCISLFTVARYTPTLLQTRRERPSGRVVYIISVCARGLPQRVCSERCQPHTTGPESLTRDSRRDNR